MRDELTAGTGQSRFTTSAVPIGRVDVFRNGLLQRIRSGEADYSESVSPAGLITASFPAMTEGHFVTLLYRT